MTSLMNVCKKGRYLTSTYNSVDILDFLVVFELLKSVRYLQTLSVAGCSYFPQGIIEVENPTPLTVLRAGGHGLRVTQVSI